MSKRGSGGNFNHAAAGFVTAAVFSSKRFPQLAQKMASTSMDAPQDGHFFPTAAASGRLLPQAVQKAASDGTVFPQEGHCFVFSPCMIILPCEALLSPVCGQFFKAA